ncbi:JAB domain-containing protein [Candidatus Methanoperedens nitratireducens]|uniref:MPN domain-containing protein n=1 Tax=Candidatus Methanoperedens nitratireducens TaxID=1392998 RepID=A0A284VMD3_9EURY|nr:JAB domain-containing protein [Candidatus Methanoperedens nitroreducens]SNQ60408.1 hypothetical protein MNV_180040 [Candidatus Methanoperedens nitroreducens]
MKCEGYATDAYGICEGEATKRVLIGTLPFHLCEKCYGRLRKDLGVRKGVRKNPTLIIARDGSIHRKVRGKKAVPVHAGMKPEYIPHTRDCLRTGSDPYCIACAAIRQKASLSNPRVFIENPTKEEIQEIADHFQCPVVRIKRARKNPVIYGEAGDTGNMILRDKQKTLEELLGKEGYEKEKREFEERVAKSQSDPERLADLDRQEREYKKLLEEQQKELEKQTKHSKDLPYTFRIEQVIMRKKPNVKINSPEDVVRLMKNMEDHDREHAEIIHLDTKNQVVGIENISTGSINASIVHPRETVKGAVLNNSAHVIFVHNHPSGNPEPSKEDMDLTKRLKDAFGLLGIDLLDSMIIGKDGSVSLKERGVV